MKKPIYAVPDLHGRFDLFQMAIDEITKRGGGKVVFTGDYVDRGPQSAQIIQALIDGPPEDQEWICLMGNHEDMMISALMGEDVDLWLVNGGNATAESYDGSVPVKHLEWLKRLPKYHETGSLVFVHAGCNSLIDLAEQPDMWLLWYRPDPKDYDYSYNGKHVVHGHTPIPNGPMCLNGRTNLDTGAFMTGRLVVGVFEDETPGPVDFIELRGEPGRRMHV